MSVLFLAIFPTNDSNCDIVPIPPGIRSWYTQEPTQSTFVASSERVSDQVCAEIVVVEGPRALLGLSFLVLPFHALSPSSRRNYVGEFGFGDGALETGEMTSDETNNLFVAQLVP